MKKLTANNTNNQTAWRRLLSGEAILLGACLGLGTLCLPALGQSLKTTGLSTNWGNSYDYGSEWAGAYGSFNVSACNKRILERTFNINEKGYAAASASASAGVKLVKKRIDGVAFSLAAHNDNASVRLGPTNFIIPKFPPFIPNDIVIVIPARQCSWNFQVAGYTVDSGTSDQSHSGSKSYDKTFWSGSATYTIGPVPITVSGSVGAGASAGYSVQVPANGASLSANASLWMTASAGAGVGAFGCSVGPVVHLELGKTTFTTALTVTPTTISGNADLVFDPVKFELDLTAYLFGTEVGSVTLASDSAAASTVHLITPFSITNKACLPSSVLVATTATQAKLPVR
jgi:hypothetical protein